MGRIWFAVCVTGGVTLLLIELIRRDNGRRRKAEVDELTYLFELDHPVV